jgi:hypothetical protein
VAAKYLQNRNVILHTDRAKSYQAKVDGMLHDSVRHGQKRVKVKGKWIWRKAVYTKLWTHTLPNGRKLKVKAGSQIIDRAWAFVRQKIKCLSCKVGSVRLEAAIRPAQWLYWKKGQDLWCRTGEMLAANRAARA